MTRLLPLLFLVAACASEEVPSPDPEQIEHLLLRLEGQQQGEAAGLSGKQRQKLGRAERLVAPLEKLPAEKIDPSVAEALIAG